MRDGQPCRTPTAQLRRSGTWAKFSPMTRGRLDSPNALTGSGRLYPHSYPQAGRNWPELAGAHRNNRSQSDPTGGSPRFRYAVPALNAQPRFPASRGFMLGWSQREFRRARTGVRGPGRASR
jgi:hypothetical protein